MTVFQLFAACFFVGALPGLIMVVRNMVRSYKLTTGVERLAQEEGQWLDFSSFETKRKLLRNPNSLITDKDSEQLAIAKRQALIEGRRLVRLHFKWGAVMFAGAILGAATGYWIAVRLGLPSS